MKKLYMFLEIVLALCDIAIAVCAFRNYKKMKRTFSEKFKKFLTNGEYVWYTEYTSYGAIFFSLFEVGQQYSEIPGGAVNESKNNIGLHRV